MDIRELTEEEKKAEEKKAVDVISMMMYGVDSTSTTEPKKGEKKMSTSTTKRSSREVARLVAKADALFATTNCSKEDAIKMVDLCSSVYYKYKKRNGINPTAKKKTTKNRNTTVKTRCPLFAQRDNSTVCAASPYRPLDGSRCSVEVKSAVLYAADLYREGINKAQPITLREAMKRADVYSGQVYQYFKSAEHIANTPMGSIPNKRKGIDPGKVVPANISESSVIAVDTETNLKGTKKRIAELELMVERLKAIDALETEVTAQVKALGLIN